MESGSENVSFQVQPSGYQVEPGYVITTRYYDWKARAEYNDTHHERKLPLIDPETEFRIGPYFGAELQKAWPDYFSTISDIEALDLHKKYCAYGANGMSFVLFRENDPLDGMDPLIYCVRHRIPFGLFMPNLTNARIINYVSVSFQVITDRTPVDPSVMLLKCLAQIGYLTVFLRKMHLHQVKTIMDGANEKLRKDPTSMINQAHVHAIWELLNSFYNTLEVGFESRIDDL